MALFGSKNKHPDYDPAAVSKMIKRSDAKKREILSLVRRYRKAERKKAVRLYKEIKLLLSVL